MNKRPVRRLPPVLFYLALLFALLGVVIFAFIHWRESSRPVINSIPVRQPGEDLVLIGRNFGSSPERGRVLLTTRGEPTPLDVGQWAPMRLVVRLPDGIESGTLFIEREGILGIQTSNTRAFLTRAQGLSVQTGSDAPTQVGSPWPTFRHDSRNTGRLALTGVYRRDRPWSFQTGRGIFSTPVIDRLGQIYVGSADHFFYALNPDGTLNWKYETGEIIDSAGALGRDNTITFISGDGRMYHFRTGRGFAQAVERQEWAFEAELREGISFNRWFEGNVAIGPDGTLYAGNTNFNYYAIHPDGTLKWVYSTGSNNWSQAAFGEDGTIFWGSNDTYIRAVGPDGKELWNRRTLGFIAASAAVGSDGTVYIGSFDSSFYALDPFSGETRWTFPTQDHIYSSAALGQDAQGETNAIYFGSADGTLYAVSPAGKLLWKYDTGDPIRSSPVIGLSPEGAEVVYFGCGDGKLYALNAPDGSLRWAFDTTPTDPELADRNDLNGSPALGQNGIYIGGEHSAVWYVPYDYCLHNQDERCQTGAELGDLLETFTGLAYVTPGGSTLQDFPAQLPAATLITLRLVVRENGQTVNARLCNSPFGCPADALQVRLEPPAPLRVEHSADGRYIYLLPEGFLSPGVNYRLAVTGWYDTGGVRLGNLKIGGRRTRPFAGEFTFQVKSPTLQQPPLALLPERTTAFSLSRLAAPLPTMLPSLNQIGFDYIEWIVGLVDKTAPDRNNSGRLLLWATGAKRDNQGRLTADPASEFGLPLSGVYQGNDFILSNRSFNMPITGIPIPFNQLQLRGQLGANYRVSGAALFADTEVLSIPTFGPYLVVAGLANNWYQKLLVSGTYITRPYPLDTGSIPSVEPQAAPGGIRVRDIAYSAPGRLRDGWVDVRFSRSPGETYPVNDHRAVILVVNADTLQVVPLSKDAVLTPSADASGNLNALRLVIPKGSTLPARLRAYVLLDVFPVAHQDLIEQ